MCACVVDVVTKIDYIDNINRNNQVNIKYKLK